MLELGGQLVDGPNRARVRVLHDGRDTCARRRRRARREVLTGRIARVHEMDVRVDHPGEHEQAAGVDLRRGRQRLPRHRGHTTVGDVDVGVPTSRAGDDSAAANGEVVAHAAAGDVADWTPSTYCATSSVAVSIVLA